MTCVKTIRRDVEFTTVTAIQMWHYSHNVSKEMDTKTKYVHTNEIHEGLWANNMCLIDLQRRTLAFDLCCKRNFFVVLWQTIVPLIRNRLSTIVHRCVVDLFSVMAWIQKTKWTCNKFCVSKKKKARMMERASCYYQLFALMAFRSPIKSFFPSESFARLIVCVFPGKNADDRFNFGSFYARFDLPFHQIHYYRFGFDSEFFFLLYKYYNEHIPVAQVEIPMSWPTFQGIFFNWHLMVAHLLVLSGYSMRQKSICVQKLNQ